MPDTTVLPSAPQPTPAGRRQKALRWGIPALALLVGIGIGGAGGETDVEASPKYMTLQGELSESQETVDQLADEVEDAESRIEEATERGEARLEAASAALDQRTAELDQREQALAAREAETAAAQSLTAPQQAPATAAPKPAAPKPAAPAPPVAVAPAPLPPASTSQYFKNCDAARAAGAAPVRVGDAGYGSHLDRDGDGVGCE